MSVALDSYAQETSGSSFPQKSEEGKQKWLLHQVGAPKGEMIPIWFHFPTSSHSNQQRTSLQTAFSALSSGSWHFSGKRFCSALEIYVPFLLWSSCWQQKSKIPLYVHQTPTTERQWWRHRDTQGGSPQMLLANGMREVELFLSTPPSDLIDEAASMIPWLLLREL